MITFHSLKSNRLSKPLTIPAMNGQCHKFIEAAWADSHVFTHTPKWKLSWALRHGERARQWTLPHPSIHTFNTTSPSNTQRKQNCCLAHLNVSNSEGHLFVFGSKSVTRDSPPYSVLFSVLGRMKRDEATQNWQDLQRHASHGHWLSWDLDSALT